MIAICRLWRPMGLRLFSKDLSQIPVIKNAQTKGMWKSKVKRMRRQITEEDTTTLRKERMQGSQKVVAMAMTSNLFMFCGKLYGAIQSGSASMFAESLHSLADMLNESLLMFGIWRSLKKPNDDHPYGFVTEKYAWALVSGCGVFFLGGGMSLYHGISGLLAGGHVLGDVSPALLALSGSLLFETATMIVAYRHISKSAQQANVSFFEYLKHGADPTSVQVFMEDCASVTGIAIAGVCVTMAKYLSLPILDSIGSISIGFLLSSVAIFLIRRNIASLTEQALDPIRENEIITILERDPVVLSVQDVKSTSLGPEWARFKGAEILFDGAQVTRNFISNDPKRFKEEMDALVYMSDEERKEWAIKNGGRIVSQLGKEVDRLEIEIKAKRPEVKHIDLEIL